MHTGEHGSVDASFQEKRPRRVVGECGYLESGGEAGVAMSFDFGGGRVERQGDCNCWVESHLCGRTSRILILVDVWRRLNDAMG